MQNDVWRKNLKDRTVGADTQPPHPFSVRKLLDIEIVRTELLVAPRWKTP